MDRNTPQDGGKGPEAIFEVARGFMAAKALMVASDVGLFQALADAPADAGELAARTDLTPRAARMLANAMVAVGFLDVEAGRYRNTADAAWLSGEAPADLRPMLRFMERITYRHWGRLGEAIRTGAPVLEANAYEGEDRHVYSEGMAAINAGTAQALVRLYDFRPHRRVLDVGGGTGSMLEMILRACPGIGATVFDLPDVVELARARAVPGLEAVAGDVRRDPLPAGHDAVLVANLVHLLSPEENRRLVAKVRDAVEPGARLLLVDFWTDASGTEPAMAALSGLQFLISSEGGGAYRVDEARGWLEASGGWRWLEHLPLHGATSLVVAEATDGPAAKFPSNFLS